LDESYVEDDNVRIIVDATPPGAFDEMAVRHAFLRQLSDRMRRA
jgi:hypothetical protein